MVAIEPLGDRAFLVRFEDERGAARWASAIRAARLDGVTDVVLAYRSAAVFADPDETDLDALEARLATFGPAAGEGLESRLHVVPVLYDGADLDSAASALCLPVPELLAAHSGATYDVFALGFVQGFPYAGYLPPSLSGLPRRPEPRLRVPAGSVAIAGRQTGIYPRESPGGWHLLGRTPLRIAVPDEGHFPIRAGDRIRFRPIGADEFEELRDERL
ncbi:Kinase A inhibitor [Aquisphaera giovannonii]|uniref:Kinase A inhibitor n=1 Tax=Aquisphaera giovannonii TaxID=406548 RepID=A0A5B9VYG3_9BACT|nr:carboxyltransferase domain-containing protein [Aquisphaera giovannonii]QEH32775.1 Kinase A inhibitor [Aquisphaera giovannonii]